MLPIRLAFGPLMGLFCLWGFAMSVLEQVSTPALLKFLDLPERLLYIIGKLIDMKHVIKYA